MLKKLQKIFPIIACSFILSYFHIVDEIPFPMLILFVSGYIIYRFTEFVIDDISFYSVADIALTYGFILIVDLYMLVIGYIQVDLVILPAAVLCIATGFFYPYNSDLIDYDPSFWDEDLDEDNSEDHTK